jgi:hypothetical protein
MSPRVVVVCPSDSFSILNIGRRFLSAAVAGYQYEIMAQLGKAVGMNAAPIPVKARVIRMEDAGAAG